MKTNLILFLIFATFLHLRAQEGGNVSKGDTTTYYSADLDEVVVLQSSDKSLVTQHLDANFLDMQLLDKMPKLAGSADPLRYVQTLGGVTTNSETQTGLSIQGCDPHQSIISISDAPIYYPNHLMGLFSVFSAGHFSTLKIERGTHDASMPNRVGGLVDFQPKHIFRADSAKFRPNADISVGLIHTEGTLALPISRKQSLVVSARLSYINLLYSKLLRFNGIKTKYDFEDANITYSINPSDKDSILITSFFSHDRLRLTTDMLSVNIPWYNALGAFSWKRSLDKGTFCLNLNGSTYQNRLSVEDYKDKDTDKYVKTELGVSSVDIKPLWSNTFQNKYTVMAGAEYCHYFNRPISFEYRNFFHLTQEKHNSLQHADEASVFADFQHSVSCHFSYSVGLRGNMYVNKKVFLSLDPRITLKTNITNNHQLSLHYGIYHQYLHRSALLSGGLPTDFYMLADTLFKPEMAHTLELNYLGSWLNNKYTLTVSFWFKQLYNLLEQKGNIADVLLSNADYLQSILKGDGRNYGASLSFNKTRGVVTGYFSYTLSWANRRWPQLDESRKYTFRSNQDRRHNFNLSLSVHIRKKWTISTLFVLASGQPYTAPEELYMLNRQIICRYGRHNAATMPLYHRLDLSASYSFIKNKDKEIGVSVSIYNLYQHRNPQFFVLKRDGNLTFFSYLSTIIPSLDFYVKI